MKKRELLWIAAFVMLFCVSACGSRPVAEDETVQKEEGVSGETVVSEENSPLADWYNSERRLEVEKECGFPDMTLSLSIEEPDTIVFNYTISSAYDFSTASPNDINNIFGYYFDDIEENVQPAFAVFRETQDSPLTTLRVVFWDAEGNRIYSRDIAENSAYSNHTEPSENTVSSEGRFVLGTPYDNLQDWIDSGDADSDFEDMFTQFEAIGVTAKVSSDGNVLVIENYFSDELGLDKVPQEEIKQSFEALEEEMRESMIWALYEIIYKQHGLKPDAIRFDFYTESGVQLASLEFENEWIQ